VSMAKAGETMPISMVMVRSSVNRFLVFIQFSSLYYLFLLLWEFKYSIKELRTNNMNQKIEAFWLFSLSLCA
jgi:hypothetical protein